MLNPPNPVKTRGNPDGADKDLKEAALAGMQPGPLQPGQLWSAALPPLLAGSVLLTCNGLHLGQLRGGLGPPPGLDVWWSPERGVVRAAAFAAPYGGLFVPGKDVVVPNIGAWRGPAAGGCGGAAPGGVSADRGDSPGAEASGRTTLLYFEGRVRPVASMPRHNVRAAAAAALSGLPGIAVRTSEQAKTPGLEWDPARSLFCLAPQGSGGGYGEREIEAASLGCVPVFVSDNTSRMLEEALPPDRYSLRFEEGQARLCAGLRAGVGLTGLGPGAGRLCGKMRPAPGKIPSAPAGG